MRKPTNEKESRNMTDLKVTDIEIGKTALVVIDLQQGIANSGRQVAPYTSGQVIHNAFELKMHRNRLSRALSPLGDSLFVLERGYG